jgi:hypothetical protein
VGALAAGGLAEVIGAPAAVAAGGVVCSLAAAAFALALPRIREHIRPIYRRIGILPEVAQGIQEASEPRTALLDGEMQQALPEEESQSASERRT